MLKLDPVSAETTQKIVADFRGMLHDFMQFHERHPIAGSMLCIALLMLAPTPLAIIAYLSLRS